MKGYSFLLRIYPNLQTISQSCKKRFTRELNLEKLLVKWAVGKVYLGRQIQICYTLVPLIINFCSDKNINLVW